MDHILKALNEHIAYQNWRLTSEIRTREELEKEVDRLTSENHRLSEQVMSYKAGNSNEQ